MISELLDILKDLPLPLKEWLVPILLVASLSYRLYKRVEPQIYRKTLNAQAVEAAESYATKSANQADSPVQRVIDDARQRHAFHRISNIDAKEPQRTMLAKLYLAIPEADWTTLKEAQPYIKAYCEDERAVSIYIPWIDVVGNVVTLVTSVMFGVVSVGLMYLVFEIVREWRDFALLFPFAMLSLGGSVILLVTSVSPIRAVQLRRMIRKIRSNEIKLVELWEMEALTPQSDEANNPTLLREEVEESLPPDSRTPPLMTKKGNNIDASPPVPKKP